MLYNIRVLREVDTPVKLTPWKKGGISGKEGRNPWKTFGY